MIINNDRSEHKQRWQGIKRDPINIYNDRSTMKQMW